MKNINSQIAYKIKMCKPASEFSCMMYGLPGNNSEFVFKGQKKNPNKINYKDKSIKQNVCRVFYM